MNMFCIEKTKTLQYFPNEIFILSDIEHSQSYRRPMDLYFVSMHQHQQASNIVDDVTDKYSRSAKYTCRSSYF